MTAACTRAFHPSPTATCTSATPRASCSTSASPTEFGGKCNLRFDDTNPSKEETEYVDSIIEDVRWLGGDFGDRLFYASDYFEQLYDWAVQLIQKGKAYVCDLSGDQVRETRGTLTEPGKNSPYRDRSVEENLDLFARMKDGEFPDGSRTLRAKIDMASPNLNMRDPVMYRILHAEHHRTGNRWCIYPMYDCAHGQCDSIEGITHSICTLEFEDHRPLYDWYIDQLGIFHPQQIEFDRLNLTYTLMSKRKLLPLVQTGHGGRLGRSAHADHQRHAPPRLLRRKVCAISARNLGVSKTNGITEFETARILRPRGSEPDGSARDGGPAPAQAGDRRTIPKAKWSRWKPSTIPRTQTRAREPCPFGRELWIEQDDFREAPPKGYFRLYPGNEVRLRYGYFITCHELVKDPATGEITEIHCTYDPATRSGQQTRKVKSTIHWVSAAQAIPVEVRLYDKLFTAENPNETPEGQTSRCI